MTLARAASPLDSDFRRNDGSPHHSHHFNIMAIMVHPTPLAL